MGKVWMFVILGVVIAGIIAAIFIAMMFKPLYEPGKLKNQKEVSAAVDEGNGFLKVAEGISLYKFEEGSGDGVIYLHGGPGAPLAETPKTFELLKDEYKFTFYQMRGCGKSTKPIDSFGSKNYYENMKELDRKLGMGEQLLDIERIRKFYGYEKITLVGHSFGGFMALLYAIEFPERVKKLVLISPADMLTMKPGKTGLFGEVEKKLSAEEVSGYKAFVKEYLNFGKLFEKNEAYFKAMNEKFGKYYFEALKNNGGAEKVEGFGESGGWISNGFYMSLGMYYDYTKFAKHVNVPTLIIGGESDFDGQHKAEEEYKRLLVNSEYKIIPKASHFSQIENPEETAKVIGEFLE